MPFSPEVKTLMFFVAIGFVAYARNGAGRILKPRISSTKPRADQTTQRMEFRFALIVTRRLVATTIGIQRETSFVQKNFVLGEIKFTASSLMEGFHKLIRIRFSTRFIESSNFSWNTTERLFCFTMPKVEN